MQWGGREGGDGLELEPAYSGSSVRLDKQLCS